MPGTILRNLAVIFFTSGLALFTGAAFAETTPITKDQERAWMNHLIPLPHEISIPVKVVTPCAEVRITLRPGASELEKSAASELQNMFKRITGSIPDGRGFEILVGIADKDGKLCGRAIEGAAALKDKPNKEQAYIIKPLGENALALTGLDARGVYYAAVTLRALMEPATSSAKTEIPLAAVTDWPDIEERGLWNCETMVIEIAPFTKLNFSRAQSKLEKVRRDAPNHASVNTNEIEQAQLRAVRHMPDITHLNFLQRAVGLYDAYPELKGQGARADAGQYHAHQSGVQAERRAPCASNPMLSKILAEWLMDVAASGVPECGCWLTERPAQCECANCMAAGQFVLEARAFEAAWKEVVKKYPAFVIRLFISTVTEEKYDQVVKELPAGVKVDRACELTLARRHSEPRDVFVNEAMDAFAAKGGWVATWDAPISSNGKVETPEFKTPHCSAERIRNFVSQMAARKYSGIYGMRAFGNAERINGFNIHALAEWSWNLNGRSEREFAIAWATREGFAEPEKVGDWAALMGPVEWDVYGSGFPECYAWGEAADMVKAGTRPECGRGMFRYYASPNAFDEKIAACGKALAIAASFKSPDLANETKVVRSYILLAKGVFQVADAASAPDAAKPEGRKRMSKAVDSLKQAGAENIGALRAWRTAIGPEPWHHRLHAAINATAGTVSNIVEAVAEAPAAK